MGRIGIVGGGQLGKMIAIASYNLGFKSCVFSEEEDSPAVTVSKDYIIAPLSDKSAVFHFAESVDFIVFETENIPNITLDFLSEKFNTPNTNAVRIAQNRLLEKEFITKNKIHTTKYCPIYCKEDLKKIDFPVILKTVEGGYDGKGQILIRHSDQINDHVIDPQFPLVAEEVFDISKELSIVVARNETGKVHFPIAENVHVNGILKSSRVPSDIPKKIKSEVERIGFEIADLLQIKGLICIEFFLNKENILVVNEVAPRPHNSCHWSMDCCDVDQFEELILSITGNKLKQPNLIHPCTMVNILGDEINNWKELINRKNTKFYNYGKEECKPLRKMGHMNVLFS